MVQSGTFAEPFGGPKAIFGGSLGSLGAPGWPKTGPKRARDAPREGQGRPKSVSRGLFEASLGVPAPSKNQAGAPKFHFLYFGPFLGHFWVIFGTIFEVSVAK